MADLLELLLYTWAYIYGFWAYIFSRDFRRAIHEEWRSRTGVHRLRTGLDVTLALTLGPIMLTGPLALIGVMSLI